MKIDVLGTKYTVVEKLGKDEAAFEADDVSGYCDPTSKRIVIRKDLPPVKNAVDNYQQTKKDTIRHELTHAFLFECGATEWAQNEALVECVSVLFPKILKAMQEAGGLE